MENKGNKVFNPIKQAREQANLNKQNSVTNPNLDMFGNSEVGTTPVAPQEPITPLYMDDVQPTIPVDNSYAEPVTPVTPVEPVTPATQPVFEAPVEEPVITASAEEIAKASEEFEAEVMGIINTQDVNTNPTIVPEEPVKKSKRVRVVNSNDAVITPEDIKASRKFAWLAYILFFIPLLINKENAYVRHNANEGLEINLCDLIAGILILVNVIVKDSVGMVASFLFMIGSIVGWGLLILTTITKIYMIVVSLLGKRANTPWFWNLRIIK